MKFTISSTTLAAVALLVLAACGGGGGSPPAPEPPPPPPADDPPPDPDPTPPDDPIPDPDPEPMPPTDPDADLEPPFVPEVLVWRVPAAGITSVGSIRQLGREDYDEFNIEHMGQFEGTRTTWSYSGWGLWGGAGTFMASISGTMIPGGPSTSLVDPFYTSVTGLRSFDNPVGSGTAVWTGNVRAYETHPDTFGRPVEGDARLEMNLDTVFIFSNDIDVFFTNFDRGHPNMSWYGVSVNGGSFRAYFPGDLEGDFYGSDHEGVAGTFHRDGLKGIFGALRE